MNQNQAGRTRARAELERSTWNYIATRQRILYEVPDSHGKYRQAREALEAYQSQVLPAAQEVAERSQKSYELGETEPFAAQEYSRQWITSGGLARLTSKGGGGTGTQYRHATKRERQCNMKYPVLLFSIFSSAFLFVVGCNRNEAKHEKTDPPAVVSRKVSESDLITIKLTPEAEKRLGIRTYSVRKEKVSRFREYAGDILLPLGNSGDASATNGPHFCL